jgi:hypothetical protein
VGSNRGTNTNGTIRKSKKYSTKLQNPTQIYDELITKAKTLCPKYLTNAIYPINKHNEWQVLHYETGGFFKPHTDSKNKYTTCTCLLFPPADGPNIHTGGKLKITNVDGTIFEFDSSGIRNWTCVMFEPTLVHECEEITSGNRFVLKMSIMYDQPLYDLLLTQQSKQVTLETIQEIKPRLPDKRVKLFNDFSDSMIKIVKKFIPNYDSDDSDGDVEDEFDEEELISQINLACKKFKFQRSKQINSPYDIEHITNTIKSTNAPIIIIVLPSFYHDLIPSNLYSDDLNLVRNIVQIYHDTEQNYTVGLKNISSTLIEYDNDTIVNHEGYLKELEDKHKFIDTKCQVIWINTELSSGTITDTGSEYNDSTYDSLYYMNYSCVVISK